MVPDEVILLVYVLVGVLIYVANRVYLRKTAAIAMEWASTGPEGWEGAARLSSFLDYRPARIALGTVLLSFLVLVFCPLLMDEYAVHILLVLFGALFLSVLLEWPRAYIVAGPGVARFLGGWATVIPWDEIEGFGPYGDSLESDVRVTGKRALIFLPRSSDGMARALEIARRKLPSTLARGETGLWIDATLKGYDRRPKDLASKRVGKAIMAVGGSVVVAGVVASFALAEAIGYWGMIAIIVLFMFIGIMVQGVGATRVYHFTYYRSFPGLDKVAARASAAAWLKEVGATGIGDTGEGLEALCGSRWVATVTKPTARKRVRITFRERAGGVEVIADLTPASAIYGQDLRREHRVVKENWGQVTDSLWKRVDQGPGSPLEEKTIERVTLSGSSPQ